MLLNLQSPTPKQIEYEVQLGSWPTDAEKTCLDILVHCRIINLTKLLDSNLAIISVLLVFLHSVGYFSFHPGSHAM